MNTTVYKTEPVALKVWAEKRMIYFELTDGRIVGFPADRFRILSQASEKQLKAVQIEVGGYALRWVRPQFYGSLKKWMDIFPIF
jgi:DUF971 family protein